MDKENTISKLKWIGVSTIICFINKNVCRIIIEFYNYLSILATMVIRFDNISFQYYIQYLLNNNKNYKKVL